MSAPQTLMFIRHAEKPGEHGGPHGVNHHGESDPHSLSVRGWTRAGALAALFGHAEQGGISRPARVFATNPNSKARSRREIDTATPTAQRLGVEIDDRFHHGEEQALANALLASADDALVVWHHGNMTELLAHLPIGNAPDVPAVWPEERFDLIWVLTHDGQRYLFRVLAQNLLAGDLPTP